MRNIASIVLPLHKTVKKGDKESLLSLFDVADRFKRMEILENADNGSDVKIILGMTGEADLKLGSDMEKGQQKSIMTLFWFIERSKPIIIMEDAEVGDKIVVRILLAS